MKDILKKAGELGKAIGDTVKGGVDELVEVAEDFKDDLTKETEYLVEAFGTIETMQGRFNALQDAMSSMEIVSVCYNIHKQVYVVTIKIVG